MYQRHFKTYICVYKKKFTQSQKVRLPEASYITLYLRFLKTLQSAALKKERFILRHTQYPWPSQCKSKSIQ